MQGLLQRVEHEAGVRGPRCAPTDDPPGITATATNMMGDGARRLRLHRLPEGTPPMRWVFVIAVFYLPLIWHF